MSERVSEWLLLLLLLLPTFSVISPLLVPYQSVIRHAYSHGAKKGTLSRKLAYILTIIVLLDQTSL